MKLCNTTGTYDKYFNSYEDKVKALYEIGYRCIDLSLYNVDFFKERFMNKNWRQEAEKLKKFADELGAEFVQAHAPNTNPLSENNLIELTRRSIEVCGVLGIDRIVYHAGWEAGIDKEAFFARNKKYLAELLPIAEENCVNLLVENSSKFNMPNMYYFFDGKDMVDFIDYVNNPFLNACWDIGHANIEGHQYEDIVALGKHLLAIHIHDNKGKADHHELLFTGSVNMDEVMCALLDSDYKGYFTFESENALRSTPRKFEREQRLIKAPLKIRNIAETLCYETGKFVLESYNCFDE